MEWHKGKFAYGSGAYRLKILNRLRQKCNDICYLCELPLKTSDDSLIDIDHVVPLSWGGKDDPSNWAAVHGKCNHRKEFQGANKIWSEMQRYLDLISAPNKPKIKCEDTYPKVANSITKLRRYAQEMPELFGLSYNYVGLMNNNRWRRGRNHWHRLKAVVESFDIPDELLTKGVIMLENALERSRELNDDWLSMVKNPGTWYKCNAPTLKKIRNHPLFLQCGIKFVTKSKTKVVEAKEFVEEFLIDCLLEEYEALQAVAS